jgi:hypothetical protein
MEIKDYITLGISLLALFLSIITFLYNKLLDIQNHLYRTKFDNYTKIMHKGALMIEQMVEALEWIKRLEENPTQNNQDNYNLVADKIEMETEKFFSALYERYFVISKKVFHCAKELHSLYYSHEENSKPYTYREFRTLIMLIGEKQDKLQDLMYKELKIKKLRKLLYNRFSDWEDQFKFLSLQSIAQRMKKNKKEE